MTRDEAYEAFKQALDRLEGDPVDRERVRHAAVEYAHAAAMETVEAVQLLIRKGFLS